MKSNCTRLQSATPGRLTTVSLCLTLAFSMPALANPNLHSVISGSAQFSQSNNVLTVTNTPGTLIHWNDFSIRANETTRFVQQTAASTVFNRVVGGDPSQILGNLISNGKVALINPNGIVFGAGAQIDVAGLIASSLNISDADLLGGRFSFSADANAGDVFNGGLITALKGGSVVLIGRNVDNAGVIRAENGDVLLAAGQTVQLANLENPSLRIEVVGQDGAATNLGQIVAPGGKVNMWGALLSQQGSISANQVSRDETGAIVLSASRRVDITEGSQTQARGGQVKLDATPGAVAIAGKIDTSSELGQGGSISVAGQEIHLGGTAILDASGLGGGRIRVGGGLHGQDRDIVNSTRVNVDAGALLEASATGEGNGGTVVVWSDQNTRFAGNIGVRGGALSGNGGLAEVSSKNQLNFSGVVDASAIHGELGFLLLDPADVIIGNADGSTFTPGTLNAQGANVVVQAQNDLTVADAIDLTTTTNASLTLQAGRHLTVNNNVRTNGSGNITLLANNVADGETDAAGNPLIGLGGTNRLTGAATLTVNGNVVSTSGNIKMVNSTAAINGGETGDIILGGNVSTGGTITVQAGRDLMQNSGSISNQQGDSSTLGVHDVKLLAGRDMSLKSVASQRDLAVDAGRNITISDPSGSIVVINTGGLGACDDCSYPYVLPFSFSFYGTSYSTAYVSTNGLVTFGSGTGAYSDSVGGLASYKVISSSWNDWDTRTPGYGVYAYSVAGGLAFRWNVQRYPVVAGTHANFETVIYQNGQIKFNYGPANQPYAGDVTIGLSNQSSASTIQSQLMSEPSFSHNNLRSTTFTPNGASYTETLSSGSDWVNSAVSTGGGSDGTIPAIGFTTGAGLNAVRNANLTATNGSVINQTTGGATSITAKALTITAKDGIGATDARLKTAVEQLSATVSNGSAYFLNASAATPLAFDLAGASTTGDFKIENFGPMTITGELLIGEALTLKTHSPITINAPINAGGAVSLLAQGHSNNRVTVNSPIYSATGVDIDSADGFSLNSLIIAPLIRFVDYTVSGGLVGGAGVSTLDSSQQQVLANVPQDWLGNTITNSENIQLAAREDGRDPQSQDQTTKEKQNEQSSGSFRTCN